MKKKIVRIKIALSLFTCGLLLINRSYSQDFHLSQFDAFAQYLNPAMTGMFNGDMRVNLHTRSQWAKVIQNPYFTTGVGFDMPKFQPLSSSSLSKLKLGAYILNERAGTGKFNVFDFAVSAAYPILEGATHNVLTGLQLGFINKSVDFNALNFGEQYTFSSQNSGSFDLSKSSGEVFSNTSTSMADINFGVLYFYGREQSRLNPFVGASVFHITQPKENFFAIDDKLPRRYNVHAGTKINYSKYHQVNLHMLFMQQTNVREINGNIMGMSFLRGNPDLCMLYGFGYRVVNNQDAGIIHLGLKFNDITGRISYDVNVSQLKTYSNGRGGFELSLIYIRSKPIIPPPLVCPRI